MAVEHSQALELLRRTFPERGCDVGGGAAGGDLWIAQAPGRVNLIGEHTDYSGGYVLPMAIDSNIVIAFRSRCDGWVRLYSGDYGEFSEFSVLDGDAIQRDPAHPWSDYVRGVAWALRSGAGGKCRPAALHGLDGVIVGDIPRGAGLSSSAALEVAAAFALLTAAGSSPAGIARLDIALACQWAESEFVGVKCGVMDQMASVMGQPGHAVFLKCDSLQYELVPVRFREAGAALVVYDTGVRRALGQSAYNDRRREAERGQELIGQALGCVSPESFERVREALPEVTARRCEHIVSENRRVLSAVVALKEADLRAFGESMYESHASLRDLYEVSCPALDQAVEVARATPGVLGARMTGAGFGGCTITLVRHDSVDLLRAGLGDIRSAARASEAPPASYVVEASNGAAVWRARREA